MDLGTLAGGLGCFPFDDESYHPPSDSRAAVRGIQSLVGFGSLVGPLAHPVLYLRDRPHEAIPKYLSGRTSYHQP
jgi:hypothetical protein